MLDAIAWLEERAARLMQLPGRPELGHLTYCTNIHPGETWPEVRAQLRACICRRSRPRSRRTSRSASACASSAPAAHELRRRRRRSTSFRRSSAEQRLCTSSRSTAFPTARFHGRAGEGAGLSARLERRRSGSPTPTGSPSCSPAAARDADRRQHQHGARHVPAARAPTGRRRAHRRATCSGTRRISYALRADDRADDRARARARARVHAGDDRGDGRASSSSSSWRCRGRAGCAELTGLARAAAEARCRRHLGVCYDVCHAAVEFEEPREQPRPPAPRRASPCRKLQLSSALSVPEVDARRRPTAAPVRRAASTCTRSCSERRRRLRRATSTCPRRWPTLDAGARRREWRVHFHVPVFLAELRRSRPPGLPRARSWRCTRAADLARISRSRPTPGTCCRERYRGVPVATGDRARARLGARASSPHERSRIALRLGRVSNLPTVWTNVLAGMVLPAGGCARTAACSLLLVAVSLLYVGGMYLNDAFDAEIDAGERPERPIPSGRGARSRRCSPPGSRTAARPRARAARRAAFAPETGWPPVLAGLALAAAIVLYDWHHKGNPLSPVVMAALPAAGLSRGRLRRGRDRARRAVAGRRFAGASPRGRPHLRRPAGDLGRPENLWPLALLAVPLLSGLWLAFGGPLQAALWLGFVVSVGIALRWLHRRGTRRRGPGGRHHDRRHRACSTRLFLASAGAEPLGSRRGRCGFVATLALQRWMRGT